MRHTEYVLYKWHANAETHVLRIGCLVRTFTVFLVSLIMALGLELNQWIRLSLPSSFYLFLVNKFWGCCLGDGFWERSLQTIYHRCTLR